MSCSLVRERGCPSKRGWSCRSEVAGCGRIHVHARGSPRDVGSREGGAGMRAGGDVVGGIVDDACKGAGNF